MEGVLALAERVYVVGAEEIHVCVPDVEPFVRTLDTSFPLSFQSLSSSSSSLTSSDIQTTDERFYGWLSEVKTAGNAPPASMFGSAHQMGSNRMLTEPNTGVVDPKGKVWETEGLYVADASVFPSTSGVNAIITNMAICDWISTRLAKELVGEVKVVAKL